ncbi:MAG: hypothetical protein LUD02_05465 [Tannerellaceae bacterium]|nr:hypothetical protein [Tannerellaceae bacterium]MCD8263662.1 hypothetical protein [Tannerellaceae bacterium]
MILLLSSIQTASAQLIEKAEEFITTAIGKSTADRPEYSDTLVVDQRSRDSIRLQELELQVQEMKLNEILLRNELQEAIHSTQAADSLKKAEQKRSIDSLRILTSGIPVIIDRDTLFTIYTR